MNVLIVVVPLILALSVVLFLSVSIYSELKQPLKKQVKVQFLKPDEEKTSSHRRLRVPKMNLVRILILIVLAVIVYKVLTN